MSKYVTPKDERVTVPVGTLDSIIIPPTSMRGDDSAFIELINDGTDTLNAVIETSATGAAPWSPWPNDVFAGIASGAPPRPAIVDADFQFFRVRGQFGLTAGNVRVSVVRQRRASRVL